MDYQITWTAPAIEGLGENVRQIAQDNAPAALTVGLELIAHMEVAVHFPRIGPLYSQTGIVEIRCLTHGNYRLYSQLGLRPNAIEVVADRHTAREQPKF